MHFSTVLYSLSAFVHWLPSRCSLMLAKQVIHVDPIPVYHPPQSLKNSQWTSATFGNFYFTKRLLTISCNCRHF